MKEPEEKKLDSDEIEKEREERIRETPDNDEHDN
jgi:hypothetical protein